MKLLDRYIAGRILKIFLIGQMAFLCLFIFVDLSVNFSRIESPEGSSRLFTFVNYYGSHIPNLLNMSSSFIFCLSSFFALAQLERNSQLVAIFSSQISIFRVISLVLSLSLILGSLQVLNNCIFIPKANKAQILNRWSSLKANPESPINYKDPEVIWRGINVPFPYKEGAAQFHLDGVKLEEKTFQSFQAILMDQNSKPILKVIAGEGSWNEAGEYTTKNATLFAYEASRKFFAAKELSWKSKLPMESLYFSRFTKQSLTYSELLLFNHDIEFKNERFHRIADGLVPFILILICSVTSLPLIFKKPIYAYFSCLIATLFSFISYSALKGFYESKEMGFLYPLVYFILFSIVLFVLRSKKIPS